MNYYPNYYMNNNYPYNGNNSNQYMAQMPNYMTQPIQPSMQPQGLNGKIVDSADVVKATEVPIGGYGIFPKADLTEVYVKSWNNNGTTSVITYKPVPNEPIESSQTQQDNAIIMEILNKINNLETKIDSLSIPNTNNSNVKKEIKLSGY